MKWEFCRTPVSRGVAYCYTGNYKIKVNLVTLWLSMA